MQRLLVKRAWRNLMKNFPRYLALMLLIILSLFLVVCISAAAQTLVTGTAKLAQEDHLEDGQFTTFVPLTAEEEAQIRDEGVTLERMFSADYKLDDGSTLRLFKNREDINLARVKTGEQPVGDNEILVELRYSEEHDLHVGDTLTIVDKTFTISGIGTSADYEGPFRSISDSTVDSVAFGIGWVSEAAYEDLLSLGVSERSEEYTYAYMLNGSMTNDELKNMIGDFEFVPEEVEDSYFQEYWLANTKDIHDVEEGLDGLSEGAQEMLDVAVDFREGIEQAGIVPLLGLAIDLEDGAREFYDGIMDFDAEGRDFVDEAYSKAEVSNLESFVIADENPRIGCAADDQSINVYASLVAGIIVLILFAYVIAVFVAHEIERDSTIIGSLYALGVTRRDLLMHYLQIPVITTLIGGVIGLALGMSDWAINMENESVMAYYSVPDLEIIRSPLLFVYAVIMPPAIAIIVNFLVISKKLNQPALSLIRNERKRSRASQVTLHKMGFLSRFRIRQMLRELRGSIAVVFGIFISYLLLMMGINCYVLCHDISINNQEDVQYSNMYLYKYPPSEVPAGGEAAYAETFQMDALGFMVDVTVLGIDDDNPYFDVTPPKSGSEVVISDSVATKFDLKVGDTFVLEDSAADRYYAFEVGEIVPYSPSLFVFMDIDEMRELMGVEGGYFNVAFSDKDLDIPTGQLYSLVTAKDIKESSDVFLSLMVPMIYMMTIISIIILFVVMYLMMRVAIDRSSKSISLFRIFGYQSREIRKLYLDGNFFLTMIGAAISLPLAKIIMDALYPMLVFNVSCGIYLTFPWWYYAVILGCTALMYVVISQLLMRRIKKITPAAVLANRE